MIAFCRSIYTLCRNQFAVTAAAHQLISSACNAKQIEKVECNSNGQSADQHLAVQTANLLLRCEHLVGPQLHYTKHNVPLSIFCAIFWLLIFAFFAFCFSPFLFNFLLLFRILCAACCWTLVHGCVHATHRGRCHRISCSIINFRPLLVTEAKLSISCVDRRHTPPFVIPLSECESARQHVWQESAGEWDTHNQFGLEWSHICVCISGFVHFQFSSLLFSSFPSYAYGLLCHFYTLLVIVFISPALLLQHVLDYKSIHVYTHVRNKVDMCQRASRTS